MQKLVAPLVGKNSNKNKKSKNKWLQLQWFSLLLSLVLVSATTIAQQHIHTADAPAENCVVCVHGDAPAATASTTTCPLERHATEQPQATPVQPACHSPAAGYLTRAPPYA